MMTLCVLSIPAYQAYETQQENLRTVRENSYLSLAKQYIGSEVEKVLSDIRYFNKVEVVKKFLSTGLEGDRRWAQKLFVTFSANYGRYRQITLLSNTGMELIKVQYHQGQVVEVDQALLENRATSEFFKFAISERPDQVSVFQPQDDAVNGQSWSDPNPVIQYSKPLYDNSGNLLGVLVFEYELKNLLKSLVAVLAYNPDHIPMIVDSQGSFVLRDSIGGTAMAAGPRSFSEQYPVVWNHIKSRNTGQLRQPQGIYYFDDMTVEKISRYAFPEAPGVVAEDMLKLNVVGGSWRILLLVPDSVLVAQRFWNQQAIRAIYLVILLMLMPGVILYVNSRLVKIRNREMDGVMIREHRRLYEDAPCGYLSIDCDGKITKVNQTLVEWLGYENKDSVEQKFLATLVQDDGSNAVSKTLRELLANSSIHDVSLNLYKKDGSILPVTLSGKVSRKASAAAPNIDLSMVDATDRRVMEALLSHQAKTDDMTQLKNRRSFYEVAPMEFAKAQRYRRPLSIILLDVDNFKFVNDSFGHSMGDKALKSVASTVNRALRSDTVFARYGGDEFILLLPETTLKEATVIAERLRESIASIHLQTHSGQPVSLSASLGVAAMAPGDSSVQSLIRKADEALYNAKGEGRNRAVEYPE